MSFAHPFYLFLLPYTRLAFTIVLFLVPTLVIAENSNSNFRGFIEMQNQHPLAIYHESFIPHDARLLDPGRLKTTLGFYWSNTLNRKRSNYIIDAETRMISININHGILTNWQLSYNIPFIWQGEGVADPWIDNWHQFFSLPRGGRNRVNDNSFNIEGNSEDRKITLSPQSLSLGDITLRTSHRLIKSENSSSLILEALLHLPTSQSNIKQNGIDLGLSLIGSYDFHNLSSSFGLNYLWYGDTTLKGLEYNANHYAVFGGMEYAFNPTWKAFLTLIAESKLVKNLDKYPNHSLYFDLGITYVASEQLELQLGFRENLSPSQGTVDFSLMCETAVFF